MVVNKIVPVSWVFVILLTQISTIHGCMNEVEYQEQCLGPFTQWYEVNRVILNICNNTEGTPGEFVFNCMRDELACETHPQNTVEDWFQSSFEGLNYDKPLICEMYQNEACTNAVNCAQALYDYAATDLYGFFDFFCGHSNRSSLGQAIGCIEEVKTICPLTFQYVNNTVIIQSETVTLTFGELNDRIVQTECPKMTDLDVGCVMDKEAELKACGVTTNLKLTESSIQCGYFQVSRECMTGVCSNTLSTFFINLFELIQCGVQRIACSSLEDNYGIWGITRVGEQAVIVCDKGYEGSYSRLCQEGAIWASVVGECTLITTSTTTLSTPITSSTTTTTTTTPTTTTTTSTTTTTTPPPTTTTTTRPTTTPKPVNVTEALATLDDLVTEGNVSPTEPPTQEAVETLGQALNDVATGLQQQKENSETNEIPPLSEKDTETVLDAFDQLLKPRNIPILKVAQTSDDSAVDGGTVLESMETIIESLQKSTCESLAPGASKETVKDNIVLEFSKKSSEGVIFPKEADNYKANINIPTETMANKGISELCSGGVYYQTLQGALEPGNTIAGYTAGTSQSVDDAVVNSDIVSIQLITQQDVTFDDLDPPIKVIFDIDDTTLENPVCVYWDFKASNGGEWSGKGCRVKSFEENTVTCECTHLTNFAILMSPKKISGGHAKALSIISAAGCGLSILCLLLTIIIHALVWRLVRSDRSVILMNVCIVLLLGLVLFLAGINRTESKEACTAIAALLQFLFLTVFFLMLLTGIEILISIVHVYTTKFRIKILLPLSYLIPAVIVGASLGITKAEGYGNDEFCWLDINSGLIWAFIGPVLFVIFINFIVVIIVFKKMASTTFMKNKSLKSKVQTSIRSVCVLVPIMGLAWVLGVISVNTETPIFAYLFAVCNTLQGLFIFLMHCVFNRQIRDALKHRQARKRSLASFSESYRNKSQSKSFSADQDIVNSRRNTKISMVGDGSDHSSGSGKNKKNRRRSSSSDGKHRKASWPDMQWG